MFRIGLISLFFLVFTAYDTVQAQIKVLPRESLEAIANPRLSPDSASLAFDCRRIVAEPMNVNDGVKTFRYVMTNVGKHKLDIHKITTTCSCTVAMCDRKELTPGDTAVLSVAYDPKGHPGRFERRIFVYTRPGQEPSAILSLAVTVEDSDDFSGLYAHKMGGIRLRRTQLEFNPDGMAIEKIPFVNLSGAPMKLDCDRAMLPACIDFSVEPEIVKDREEGEIIIKFDPSKSKVRPVIPVLLKGLGLPPSQSSLIIKIENQ